MSKSEAQQLVNICTIKRINQNVCIIKPKINSTNYSLILFQIFIDQKYVSKVQVITNELKKTLAIIIKWFN